jgi:hypothetical protein
MGCSALPMAQHKGDDHAHHRSHGTNSRRPYQDAFPMLLKQTGFRFALAPLRLQDQIPVELPPKISVWLHRHEDPVKLFGQAE